MKNLKEMCKDENVSWENLQGFIVEMGKENQKLINILKKMLPILSDIENNVITYRIGKEKYTPFEVMKDIEYILRKITPATVEEE